MLAKEPGPDRGEEGVWPRVYRARRRQVVFLCGLGAVFGAAGVGALAAAARLVPPRLAAAVVFGGLLIAGVGLLVVIAVRRARLLLWKDAIEVVELGRPRRRLRRDQIAGRRVFDGPYGRNQVLFERLARGERPYRVGSLYERDDVLDAWLESIPDLDVRDRSSG